MHTAQIILSLHLLVLHGPNGQEIDVNPNEITSLREPRQGSDEHFAKGVRCLVRMTDGNINTVVEECRAIREMIEAKEE
jgi:hypothetical protein